MAQSAATASAPSIPVRFIDSATGYAIQPETVTTRAHRSGALEKPVPGWQISKAGRAVLSLEPGRHTVLVAAPNHKPMAGEVEADGAQAQAIYFLLDPVEEPRELRPDCLASLQRDDATLVQGFIVDDETGEPLAAVGVTSLPSGAQAFTDKRGFFQLYVPVQSDSEAEAAPANLVLHKDGYQTAERQHLELWPRGDWTYRLRLVAGNGTQTIDERWLRRRAPASPTGAAALAGLAGGTVAPAPAPFDPLPESLTPKSTAGSNSTVRVPRNIRVLNQSNIIEYVTMDYYCKHVLPAEWINSWGGISGGSNSLSAGAVAVRCYAINYVNHPKTTTYDICGTSACQNYGVGTYSASDTAVNFTADYVLINSSGVIPATEYSAENNSITNGCGDGFTQPTGGCVFDPACAGDLRFGHGRGMCQWGTARWATGRKMTGRVSADTTPNGYPPQDWAWIVRHYYPTLTLVKGAPLLIGDDVKAAYDTSIYVNQCADGGITDGVNCPLLADLPVDTGGVIVDGPQRITADGRGYTWYRVRWNDATNTVGWSKENYLERIYSAPTAPTNLTATAAGSNQINLTWSDTTSAETGFAIERANASGGPWVQLNLIAADVLNYADKGLYPGSTWFYRLRAYNAGGNSPYSNLASATTSNAPPILSGIGNRTITETTLLTFTNSASATDLVQLLTDCESFPTETTNSVPLFRNPRASATTSANLGTPGTNRLNVTPDLTVVTGTYTTNGHGTGRVLRVSCQFTNPNNPWLRLTTSNAPSWRNPVIDFTRKLRLDLWADKPLKLAVGCRETATAAGTPIGSNGGTSGAIEWAGVTNTTGGAPMPNRSISASNWTTLTFDFTTEPIRNFSGGDGVLWTSSGLGVLEHLAIVPAAGTGVYNIHLDNFAVLAPRVLTYSLAASAPTNAAVSPATGVFTWTPSEAQGPCTSSIPVIVSDNSPLPLGGTNTFVVVVNESNSPPALTAISNRIVHAGMTVAFTNSATDPDLPPNTLTYSLDPGAPPNAGVSPAEGVFTWPTTDADANSTSLFAVRVSDNGAGGGLSAVGSFTVSVQPKPTVQLPIVSGGSVTLSWSAIDGTRYRVQYKDDLDEANWNDRVPDVIAAGPVASMAETPGIARRFYRILVVN